jgi:DNA helicase II / ATP-dependent DNA helicase PcrA
MDRTHFDSIFAALNASQKKVVESIYGSYMVVAGPGTGKTQTLSARTAHILLSTDIAPENILITSFTEAGVSALKRRLFNFIGAASYRVCVTTLHALAQDTIDRYPEHFLQYRALSPLDELESYELIEQILAEGRFPILSPVYDPHFYVRDIVSAISKCREEGVSPADLIDHIRNLEMEHQEILMSIKPTLVKYTSTATKQAREISKLRELQQIYRGYSELKHTLGKYDFSDMILHVANELKTNTHLALELAEQYQIVMVDEFQDLSNSQSQLIEGILRSADEPNIMTVGDDDQSIYRFQGANLENMLHFCEKYPSTEILVLSDNYRSHEEILEASRKLIHTNSTRLSALIPSLIKPLTSIRGTGGSCSLVSYANKLAEMTAVLESIQVHLQEGIAPSEIAILVRKNAEVREWVEFITSNGISVQSNLTTNLLDSGEKRLLCDLLRVVALPKSPSDALIELLRIGFFAVPRIDLYRLTRALEEVNYRLTRKMELLEFLLDDTLLEGVVGENISLWQKVRAQII